MKQMTPPFIPGVSEVDDVSKIDPEFLAEVPHETPVQNSALMRTLQDETQFDNFTYVNEQNLSMIGSEAGAGLDQSSQINNSAIRNQTELVFNK